MNYRTNYVPFKILKFRLQPYRAHSAALQSQTKPLQKKQQSEMSIFVLHGRFPWPNMIPVSSSSLMKLEGMIRQMFARAAGHHWVKLVFGERVLYEARNTPYFQLSVWMVLLRWIYLKV